MQRGFAVLFLIVGILTVALLAGGAFYLGQRVAKKQNPNRQACTLEAKVCPDGTNVGRTGPNCEFAPCPNVADETANWKTYTYKNISFKYPADWIVVFDSEVAGQTNGFSLHIQRQGDTGLQPDELGISTFNDREGLSGDNGYILNSDRTFTQTNRGDSYIQFTVNNIPVYAGCGYYSKGMTTIEVCNKVLSTLKFLQ